MIHESYSIYTIAFVVLNLSVSSYSRVTRTPPYYPTSFKLTSICVDKLRARSGPSGLPQLQEPVDVASASGLFIHMLRK